MCAPDPNAGIRYQAKIEKQKKDSRYRSDSLKYWNREVSAKQRQGSLTKGLSRTRSDAYSKALWTLGKGRLANANLYKSKTNLRGKQVDLKRGVSRSNRYMSAKYKEILDKQRQIESTINNTFGRNMDIANQMITRNHMQQVAKNRQALGTRPEYGVPVMMPPRDTMGQMFNTISMGLSIASLFAGSDIRLKENIKEVGKSDKGFRIFEWNYKSDQDTRYRGVIAQDVMKIEPTAVMVNNTGYLAVNYAKTDVPFEVIS